MARSNNSSAANLARFVSFPLSERAAAPYLRASAILVAGQASAISSRIGRIITALAAITRAGSAAKLRDNLTGDGLLGSHDHSVVVTRFVQRELCGKSWDAHLLSPSGLSVKIAFTDQDMVTS
jgi:hypothetical protein